MSEKDSIFMMFVFLSVIGGLLVKQLKEQTQNYVEIVEVYIKQVLVPLENENEPIFVDIEYDLIKGEVEHICSMLTFIM